jgi:hypothetical protein
MYAKPNIMTYIIVIHEELDAKCYPTGNIKETLHRTEAVDRAAIDRWVFAWAENWRSIDASQITNEAAKAAEYFNPYVGEVNESTWN